MDSIADLLTRIRNAGIARHASIRVPYSKEKADIVEIFRNEGYIDDFSIDDGDGVHRELVVHLRYLDNFSVAISEMKRVSKPSRRVYCGAKEIPKVKSGLGVAILSTPKGILTDRDARRLNVGGEVLCEIW